MSTLHPNNGILNIQVSMTGHDQTDRQITFILEKMERTKIPSSSPPPPPPFLKQAHPRWRRGESPSVA